MDLQHKTFEAEVIVKDAEQGIVEVVTGRVGVKDLVGDLALPGAFGRQRVRVSAWGHGSWPHRGNQMPVGRGEIREMGDRLVAEVKFFMNTQSGREHFEVVKEMGDLQEWSYGFRPALAETVPLTSEMHAQGVKQAFSRIPVAEVSPVLLAASPGTGTISIKCDACGAKDDAPPEPEKTAEEEKPEAEAVAEVEGEDEGVEEAAAEAEPEEKVEETTAEAEEDEAPDLQELIAREVGRAEALRASGAGA